MLNQMDQKLLQNSLPFWNELSPDEVSLLYSGARSIHFSKGQSLYRGDMECAGVLIMKSGSIRVYITSEEGREVTLYILDSGDICIFSASCVLESIDFDVSIDAKSDCDILQVSSSVFSSISSKNVYVELFSYKLATERFSDVMWAMQQILFTSFDKRLARFLIEESKRSDSPDISMTHEQIAKYLGSAREVVSKMLKYFSHEGYVSLSRGGIHILDKIALIKLAH